MYPPWMMNLAALLLLVYPTLIFTVHVGLAGDSRIHHYFPVFLWAPDILQDDGWHRRVGSV